jgi:hypothetical protein
MTRAIRLPRRTFLRGMFGAAVGLPVLECMLDDNGTLLSFSAARAQSSGLPRRYAVVFAGQAIGGDGFDHRSSRIGNTFPRDDDAFIVPSDFSLDNTRGVPLTGNLENLPVTIPLRALQNQGLLGDVQLVSGLAIPFNRNSADGSAVPVGGAFRDFHGGGASPLLSGTRSTTSSFVCNGPTSDQLVAQLNAGQTNIPSLVLRAQPAFYVSGFDFANREFISYSTAGRGGQIAAQTNPQIAWQSLFATFVPDDAGAAALQAFTQQKRLSVLDLVNSKRQRLLGKVGAADRVRLERHFDELRALEERVRAIPPPTTGTCQALPDPGAPPSIGGDNAGSGSDLIQENTGYSGEDERARVMCDLIHMAFVCDLTRAATLQITAFQSHMNVIPLVDQLATEIGRPGLTLRADLHEVGHNGDGQSKGQVQVSMMLYWHVKHYAYLMKKLKDTPEGAGNVLDNSCIVFMPEAGHGTQLNDASSPFATHSVEDMILLVGGRAGTLRPGRHHHGNNSVHPAQVLLAAMQSVGYSSDTFGEVSGAFTALF